MASRFPFILIGPRAIPTKAVGVIIAALLIALFVALSGCVREEDITLEQRAHQLNGELMCPVCDGQTIDGSSAQISIDMRLKVRELLDEGKTNAEVRDYFVLRYGQEILAAPERSGFNLLAWVVPVVIVLGGIGIALITIKNMRKSSLVPQSAGTPSPTMRAAGGDLSDYLAQVDRDLGISSERISGPADDVEPTVDQSDKVSR
jgi:cytochrome c-type biogenesis protein CcmH